jgi:hypothetical protein
VPWWQVLLAMATEGKGGGGASGFFVPYAPLSLPCGAPKRRWRWRRGGLSGRVQRAEAVASAQPRLQDLGAPVRLTK